jgi:hypothetical protein
MACGSLSELSYIATGNPMQIRQHRTLLEISSAVMHLMQMIIVQILLLHVGLRHTLVRRIRKSYSTLRI